MINAAFKSTKDQMTTGMWKALLTVRHPQGLIIAFCSSSQLYKDKIIFQLIVVALLARKFCFC